MVKSRQFDPSESTDNSTAVGYLTVAGEILIFSRESFLLQIVFSKTFLLPPYDLATKSSFSIALASNSARDLRQKTVSVD